MRKPRFFRWVLLGFVTIGVGLLVGSALAYWSTRRFVSTAVTAEATIVAYAESINDGKPVYHPVVVFTSRDGQNVVFRSSTGSSSQGPIGERVEVLYDPRDPYRALIHSFPHMWSLPLTLMVLGLAFAGLGVVVLIAFGRCGWSLSRAEVERLRADGRRLMTTFQDVIADRSCSVNGRNPFCIITRWQDPASNAIHVFESEPLWLNPRDYIQSDEIPVYVDRDDISHYYMDTSFLPRLTGWG